MITMAISCYGRRTRCDRHAASSTVDHRGVRTWRFHDGSRLMLCAAGKWRVL